MAFKDILLALTSYPDPTPVSVVEDAVSLAATLGAHLSAVSCEVRVEVPGHFLAGSIANLPGIVAGEAEKSRKHAKDLLAAFAAAAEKSGVPHEVFLEKCPTYKVPDLLVDYARLRHLTIMPVPESYDQWYADTVIFASGRPILVLPTASRARPLELGTVAVAWDFSRAAARAVSDALPLLERAKNARIVTVIDEKDFDLIVFNTPMVDKSPENDIERFSLCDPHGRTTEAYLRQARRHVSKDGLIIFPICNNSAYEVMDAIDLDYEIVGFELAYSGFWRAIVGARN